MCSLFNDTFAYRVMSVIIYLTLLSRCSRGRKIDKPGRLIKDPARANEIHITFIYLYSMAQLPRQCGGAVFIPWRSGGEIISSSLSEILSAGYFLFQALTIRSLLILQFSSDLKNISSIAHQLARGLL